MLVPVEIASISQLRNHKRRPPTGRGSWQDCITALLDLSGTEQTQNETAFNF